jgi:hypothetical protein
VLPKDWEQLTMGRSEGSAKVLGGNGLSEAYEEGKLLLHCLQNSISEEPWFTAVQREEDTGGFCGAFCGCLWVTYKVLSMVSNF